MPVLLDKSGPTSRTFATAVVFALMNKPDEIAGFNTRTLEDEYGGIHVREGGDGPVVLLLHGFPETGLM